MERGESVVQRIGMIDGVTEFGEVMNRRGRRRSPGAIAASGSGAQRSGW